MNASGYARQVALIRQQCAEHGITITHQGAAYRLRGPGIDLLCVDLATVSPADLLPMRKTANAGNV